MLAYFEEGICVWGSWNRGVVSRPVESVKKDRLSYSFSTN